ncbi:tetratricopeptide repeat protein [Anabaena catenula]|uniref:Tetratricopeptide repeat protein n=1 Tax=Anabaena catenula FACHB-362 TaxID=2692877 RepID=A0ABR8IYD2_9NOST|nr:tetratricopeptide repeat protein [Anabaena catenula]MBD2691067.1 tetratricopeptide repeat protein [Anabaena catenula FACHB-362]
MAISGDDYLVKRRKQIERKQRIVTYISILSFGGSILFGAVNTLKESWEKPQQPQQPVIKSVDTELQQQVKGYELVLQREPNNQLALEKLSLLRLEMKDTKGAITLMGKLVQQHPDRQDYKVVLGNMKKQQEEEMSNSQKSAN